MAGESPWTENSMGKEHTKKSQRSFKWRRDKAEGVRIKKSILTGEERLTEKNSIVT